MAARRTEVRDAGLVEPEPFASADEAWIWAMQGMLARLAGARVKAGMARSPRPCEATDIIACAYRLHRQAMLSRTEMEILFLYGRYAVAPYSLGKAHRAATPVWRRAMCSLEQILEQKGIIQPRTGEANRAQ